MKKADAAVLVATVVSLMVIVHRAEAVPPLVVGDVPTADKHHVEWYVGTRYQKTDTIERQIPFTEVVYGISDRQEVTFEVPYLASQGHQGFGDAVVGTKYQFLKETDRYPGVAGSFEAKLDTGSQAKGFGTGAMEYDLQLRSQKTFGWFTGIVNLGYTFVGEPEENGVKQKRRDVVFTAFAQEYQIALKTKLLSEVYWENSDTPHSPHRLAADVGFKHQLLPHLAIHAAIGKSLREGNVGGPKLRVYAGIKVEFPLGKE